MKYLKWIAIGVGILLVLILARAVLESRDAKVRMEATIQAQQQRIAELDADRKLNATQAAAKKAALPKTPTTGAAAVKIIHEFIPLQAPIGPPEPPQLDAPSAYKLSEQHLKDIADYTLRCEACEIDRTRYINDVSLLEKKVEATERQRDAAVTAVKGGTKWQRFGRAAKHVGIGVAIGVAVGAAAKR